MNKNKISKFIFLPFLYLLLLPIGKAQLSIDWANNYGGSKNELSFVVEPTDDNGFIFAGTQENGSAFILWLAKVDEDGNEEWTDTYPSTDIAVIKSIALTSDGGYIVVGHAFEEENNIRLIKIAEAGNEQWSQTYGGIATDHATSIFVLADGAYLLAGTSHSNGDEAEGAYGSGDFVAIRVNENGDEIWQKKYGGSRLDLLNAAIQNDNGDFVFAGSSLSSDGEVGLNNGLEDGWILKINAQGTVLWSKIIGTDRSESFKDIQLTDDGYVMVGYNANTENFVSNKDYWIVTVDESGTVNSNQSFGTTTDEIANAVIATPDGGYLLGGTIWLFNNTHDMSLIKLDDAGMEQWSETLSGTNEDILSDMKLANDNGVVITGWSNSSSGDFPNNNGQADAWVIKLAGFNQLIVNLGMDQTICENETVTLNATIPDCLSCIYEWGDGDSNSQRMVTPSFTTSYSVTVTDGDGNTSSDDILIMVTDAPDLMFSTTNVSCFGNIDGAINLEVSGGAGGYIIAWNTNTNTEDINNLSGGVYEVTVSDANECTTIEEVEIMEPAPLELGLNISPISCFGAADGGIDLSVEGGIGMYTYEWNTGAISEDLENLGPGDYNVLVEDANGCTTFSNASFTEPPELFLSIEATPPTAAGNDGSIIVIPLGGQAPFQVNWDNGATGFVLNNLMLGSYTATVVDAGGCTYSETIILSPTTINVLNTLLDWTVFPNPSEGVFYTQITFKEGQKVKLTLYDVLGIKVTTREAQIQEETFEFQLENQAKGLYYLHLETREGISVQKIIID